MLRIPGAVRQSPPPWASMPAGLPGNERRAEALHRMMGVDLTAIPTIGVNTALTIASEIGPDFSAFPSAQHFCSWLGLAPGTRISGGKPLPGRAPKVVNKVAQYLRMAAMTARRSQTFIGARHRGRPARKDAPVAITATARELACLIYTPVTRDETIIVRYADDFVVGFQYKRDAERFLCDLKDRLADFSLDLHPDKTRLIEFGRFAMGEPPGTGRTASRDFRLPRVHALLPNHAEGMFRTGAQADREARQPDPEAHQGRVASMDASQRIRGSHMAWSGRGRLAAILCSPDQYPIPRKVCAPSQASLGLRVLRRQSQKDRFEWSKVELLARIFWPPIRIMHPWPEKRFAVNHPR